MTNKKIITSVAILSSLTIGAVAYTQLNKPNTNVAMVSGSSSVSSSNNLVQQSSTITTEYNPSQLDQAKLGNPESKPKLENELTPLKQLQVEVLDPNNPPQYITDYLICQKTSPTKQFGTLIDTEDGKLEYKCPKSLEYYGCKGNVLWIGYKFDIEAVKKQRGSLGFVFKEGWYCDRPAMDGMQGGYACNHNFGFNLDELKLGYLLTEKQISNISGIFTCTVILKKDLTVEELKLLQNYKSPQAGSLKLITIKN